MKTVAASWARAASLRRLHPDLPLLAAVGAPSSLAVELAEEFGMTLVGFLKKDKLNIYNRPDRIQ